MKRKYRRLTIDALNDEGCLNLLEEFLSLLGVEYTESFRLAKRYPRDKTYSKHLECLDEFIKSDYFGRLTGLDGPALIDALRSGIVIGSPARAMKMYQSA